MNVNLSYGFILKFIGTGFHRSYREICFVCVFNVCYRRIPDNLKLSTIDKIYGNLFYVTTEPHANFNHIYKLISHPHPSEPPKNATTRNRIPKTK